MPIMEAPESGVKVRMYRQGHGDCFLLAFRDKNDDPFYMLIDCGYKNGSRLHEIDDVVADIGEATGNHLHVVAITHEHQDHVNGFSEKAGKRFANIDIDQVWLAWTENPVDSFANEMRDKYKDTLVGLMAASLRLDGATSEYDRAAGDRLGEVLSLEADGDLAEFRALAVKGITNKKAMKYIKDKTDKDPLFLEPHGSSYWLPRVEGVRIYALGPPRDEKLLLSLDPEEDEGFEFGHLALRRQDAAFLGAASSAFQDDVVDAGQPFAPRYRIPIQKVTDSPHKQFFADHYEKEAHDWRRIDHDWLHAAEHLALRLADEVNNTSLVMAIEMPKSKQVLLFTGDAQRGSWVSWDKGDWTDGDGNQVTAQELLRRTVFYKVGHHGSHNATLKGGSTDDPHPGLEWMAQDEYRDHFVAMIPANRPWAYGKSKPWKHPLPSIEAALIQKAKGRVWRIDQDHVERWDGSSDADWEAFNKRNIETEMYFEYTIPDELL